MLGLTTYLQQAQTGVWDVCASFLPATYIEGVNRAGGIAVLLPPQPDSAANSISVMPGAAASAGQPRVSLCLIVKNEETNLPACLGSVADLALSSRCPSWARTGWPIAATASATIRLPWDDKGWSE